MQKIGLLVGRENTFPPAFIEHVNARNAGITAEYCKLGGTRINESSGYAVIIDRLSHEVPYYRSYLKNAALNGTVVINDPFWFPADDKFVGSAIAERLGVAVPRTVALPNHSYIPDISPESLRNLLFPIPWQELVEYTGLPAFLKPSVGGGWKQVYKVHSLDELIRCYDQTGEMPMILQENIEFEGYVRCICFGGEHILPMIYNPRNTNIYERYEGQADAAHLGTDLHRRIVDDARRLNQALGYTMNTVEFAIRGGIPYAIDFLNPACDLDSFSIGPVAFEWALNTLADLAISYAQRGAAPAHSYRWREMIDAFQAPAKLPPAVLPQTPADLMRQAETPAAVAASEEPAPARKRATRSKSAEPTAEAAAAPAPARKRSSKAT